MFSLLQGEHISLYLFICMMQFGMEPGTSGFVTELSRPYSPCQTTIILLKNSSLCIRKDKLLIVLENTLSHISEKEMES